MRKFQLLPCDVDAFLEDAHRAKHHLEADRWRHEQRPRAVRQFAARATALTWSRALLKAVVEELYPDDLFTALVGDLDRVPLRRIPQVLAIALALRHSWRRDGLTRLASRLGISLGQHPPRRSPRHRHRRPSRRRLSGVPRPGQGSPLRSDPARRGWRP